LGGERCGEDEGGGGEDESGEAHGFV
jgi:hypothetical protein